MSGTKSTQDTTNPLDDLMRVREILFGEQMQRVSERFSDHEARMAELEAALQAVEQGLAEQQAAAEQRLQNAIAELTANMEARFAAMEQATPTRSRLGAMLIEMGQRLQQDSD